MLEEICFILISFALFIIIFFKIIMKNDTNYVIILVLQAIGILISFIEIRLGLNANSFFMIVRYLFSVILPVLIIFIELKGLNFSEILSMILVNFLIILRRYKIC